MNSIAKILLFTSVVALTACKEEVLSPPADLIPKEDFVSILVEMNLIEATRSLNNTKEQKLDTHPTIFYRQVWKDFHITETQFERSFEFYRKDLDAMAELYEEAADILKRKEDQVNAAKRSANEDAGQE